MDAGRSSSPALHSEPLKKALASDRQNEPGFDGNRNDMTVQWYFRKPGVTVISGGVLAALLKKTVAGDVFWVLFPADVDNE